MILQYSFIIPVFNRPQEVKELLESFLEVSFENKFEIVIVEDGSTNSSKEIVDSFKDRLEISYYYKENSGPGASRNFGMERAKGNYFIILDSDCLVPPHYLKTIDSFLKNNYVSCFGGADAAHESFTDLQKAINYVMTSFLTTGGIRGKEKAVTNFEPRSFNMGIAKDAFLATGGFAKIHPGEDPDLSQRIKKENFKTAFIPNAFVYHKRRISWQKFYIQVKKFGMVRPILNKWHPSSEKIVFWFPTLFVLFTTIAVAALFFNFPYFAIGLIIYSFCIFIGASTSTNSVRIGLLAVRAMFVQFFGYGIAFLKSTILIKFLKRNPETQFPNLFFK